MSEEEDQIIVRVRVDADHWYEVRNDEGEHLGSTDTVSEAIRLLQEDMTTAR